MSDKQGLRDRLGNRLFGIPAVTQLWSRLAARKADEGETTAVPFTPLRRPLSRCRVALITTGGLHLSEQQPFDMSDRDGDASFRELPGEVALGRLKITHNYYDHRDADRDPNIIFPLDHLRDLVRRQVIGEMAPRHFGFMGHIEGEHLRTLTKRTAPAVAELLRQDRVDAVVLTPA